jgi:hypothetical protein
MMIRVVVQPTKGSFEATAILGDSSYVLTRDCHLTGGFAFFLWFGKNPNRGQFVATLGGYHPAFPIPAHFPRVPRLGFNWAVSHEVTVKGEAYFALTGSCVMAGGGLDVLFHSGELQAWFTAHTNLLIAWHPSYYVADVAVGIGVSYRLNLGAIHKTISVSLGANLHITGPPTRGVVTVDLVVVSFSVEFGAGHADHDQHPLGWDQFKRLVPDQACSIAITDGLFKTREEGENSSGQLWIVRAGRLGFQTRSAIPASRLNYAATTREAAAQGISIRPMNRTGVASTHTLKIFAGSGTEPIDASKWKLDPLRQTVPAALWSTPPHPFDHKPAQPSKDVISDQLAGFTVTAPPPRLGTSRGAVAAKELSAEYLSPDGTAPLSGEAKPSPRYLPAFDARTVGEIADTISTAARSSRRDLLAALDAAALFHATDGDLSDLADLAERAGHLFSDAPMVQR